MPLSLKPSSFCLLACLCSASWSFGVELDNNFSPPFFDQGEIVTLGSDCFLTQILGTEFSNSFIGSSTDLTLLGNNHSLKFTLCQAPVTTNSSFISATNTLTFQGFSKIHFESNQASGKDGMISGKDIVFDSNGSLIFLDNKSPYTPPAVITTPTPPAPPTTPTTVAATSINVGESSIRVENSLKILNTKDKITFLNNMANFGSAISCEEGATTTSTVLISNNTADMEFSQNFSTCSGGVIHGGKEVTFSNNFGSVTFSGNSCANSLQGVTAPTGQTFAFGAGGAICIPNGTLNIKDNSGYWTLSYNATPGAAGAIYAQTCSISNMGPLVFHSNTAANEGGAICAKVFELDSSGPVHFRNNRASKGGAIFVSTKIGSNTATTTPALDSTIKISSNKGNITFDGNMLSTLPGVRNAITVEEGGKILALQAQGSSKLFFYDPITHSLPTPTGTATLETITVNNTGYSGSVVFSAKNLSTGEQLVPANKTSTLLGKVEVKDGELRITDGAIVNVLGFTATTGRLTLGSGATLGLGTGTGTTPASEDFTINNLGFDVATFLNTNFSSAVVNSGAKKITVTGSLAFVSDDDSSLYDSDLLKTTLAIPIVHLTATGTGTGTGTGTIVRTGFADAAISVPEHYGYQGSWSSTWYRPLFATTPSGTFPGGESPPDNMLYVLWTPTPKDKATYIFAPERKTELVCNTLWSSFLANRTFSDALQETLLANAEGFSVMTRGIGNYIKQNERHGNEGYSGRFGGYQATLAMRYPDNATIGVAFGQLYGKMNSHPYDAKVSESMTVLSFFGRFPLVTNSSESLISWEADYEYTRNNLTTTYSTVLSSRQSKGQWHNNSFHVLISAEQPFLQWCSLTKHLVESLDLAGFISAEFLGGWQTSFSETGALARSFARGKAYNVALPIGCSTEFSSPFKKAPSVVTLKLAFKPDIYRVNPHTTVSVISNKESTEISGASPSRYGLFLQAHDLITFSPRSKAFLDYTLENKRGFIHQRISAGLHGLF